MTDTPMNVLFLFVNLPFKSLDRLRLQEKIDEIGHIQPADLEETMARP